MFSLTKCILFFIFLFNMNFSNAQFVKIEWNEHLRKEVQINCASEDFFCEELCGYSNGCHLKEDICKNCIGTGFKMYMIFNELGRSIKSTSVPVDFSHLLVFLKLGHYVTLSGNDIYNILDSFGSVRAYKKFEALCPENSLNQILFLQTDPESKEILAPSFIYCEFEDHTVFNFVDLHPDFEINDKRFMGFF